MTLPPPTTCPTCGLPANSCPVVLADPDRAIYVDANGVATPEEQARHRSVLLDLERNASGYRACP